MGEKVFVRLTEKVTSKSMVGLCRSRKLKLRQCSSLSSLADQLFLEDRVCLLVSNLADLPGRCHGESLLETF